MVEEGQHIVAASVQGAAQLGELVEGRGHTMAQGVDDGSHHGLAMVAVGMTVGGDDALIDTPGHHDREMVLIGEHRFQPCSLRLVSSGNRVRRVRRTP